MLIDAPKITPKHAPIIAVINNSICILLYLSTDFVIILLGSKGI